MRTFDRSWPFTLSRPKEWKDRDDLVDQAVVLTLKDILPQNTSVELNLKEGAHSFWRGNCGRDPRDQR